MSTELHVKFDLAVDQAGRSSHSLHLFPVVFTTAMMHQEQCIMLLQFFSCPQCAKHSNIALSNDVGVTNELRHSASEVYLATVREYF